MWKWVWGYLGDFEVWVWLWLVKLFQEWKRFVVWIMRKFICCKEETFGLVLVWPVAALFFPSTQSFDHHQLTFFFSFPSPYRPLSLSHKHTYAPKNRLVDSKALPQLDTHIQYTHTSAPVNHLSAGSSSREPQRESCWQEAAAPHLSVKVSENTMWLSSALSSHLPPYSGLSFAIVARSFLLPLSHLLLPMLLSILHLQIVQHWFLHFTPTQAFNQLTCYYITCFTWCKKYIKP